MHRTPLYWRLGMLEKKKSGVNLFKFLANNTEDLQRVVACVIFLKIVERGF